jgi:hypothetical protein
MDEAESIRNPMDVRKRTRMPPDQLTARGHHRGITSTRLRDDDRPTSSDACIFRRGRICAISCAGRHGGSSLGVGRAGTRPTAPAEEHAQRPQEDRSDSEDYRGDHAP